MSARADRVRIVEQAEKFVRAGRVKEAIAEYEKLSLGDPQDVGTLNIIGDLYIRLGQSDRAIRSFQRVAEEYERRGLFSQALAICKKIHKLTPDSTDHALKLGDLYVQQGFASDAKTVYASVAGRLAGAGKTAEAIAIFEKIVKLDREDHDARQALSRLYRESGNLDAALAQLNESADVRIEKGQLDHAAAVLNEALALRPGDARSIVSLVDVFKRQERPGQAVELLEKELRRGARQRPAPQHPRQHPLRSGGYQESRGDLYPHRHRPPPQCQRPDQAGTDPDPQGQARPGLRAVRAPHQQPRQEAPR